MANMHHVPFEEPMTGYVLELARCVVVFHAAHMAATGTTKKRLTGTGRYVTVA